MRPEIEVTALIWERLQGLLTAHPHFDDIIPFYKEPRRFFSTIRKLKDKKFDLVLIPYISTGPIALPFAFLTGARFILHPPTNSDFRVLVSPGIGDWDPSNMHPIEVGLKLVEWVGDTKHGRVYLPVNNEEATDIKDILTGYGIGDDERLIGLQVGSVYHYKMWPTDLYIALGKRLLDSFYGIKILLTGSYDERDLCQRVLEGIGDKRVVSIAGMIPLRAFPALIKRLSLLIAPDTGPLHVAVAVETPTVSLFSATNPDIWGPFNNRSIHRVIYKERRCDPCLKNRCADVFCMKQITVDEVFDKVQRLIDN